ncbi:MAG: CPBP family glutamic-type intramembrane protease [Myxococcota bacterium]|nr:CPBP family glutamic-type intramembrane protease [Myxococcota bacterium]
MSDHVFLIIDGQTKGPFSQQQIRDGLSSGTINPQTLGALRGGAEWKPVAEVLDDLAQGAGAPSATENLLAALRDRLRQQGPLERLGLSGDPSPMVVDKTYQRLKAQLKERLASSPTPRGKALAKEALTYLKAAVEQLRDPKERFILKRAADLGVDPAKDENRSYLSTLYYRDEAQAAFDAGRMSEALGLFDQLLELQPDNADAVWQRALALYRSDPLRTQEALSELKRCSSTWPDKVEPVRSLATLHLELGRRDEAKSLARSALEIAPNDAESKRLLDILSGKMSASAASSSGQPDVSGEFANIKGEAATKSKKQRKKGSKKAPKTKGSGGESSTDSLGFAKVAVVCALVFGGLFQMAHQTPDSCFPQGDQEYFFQPDTYYDFRDLQAEQLPGQACAPSLHPPEGSGYFIQFEAQLACEENLEADNPSVSAEAVAAECTSIPVASPGHPRSSETSFFYVRRGILLGAGILCIALLGSGRSIGERFKNLGFELDGTVGVALGFGLLVGFFSPLQFTLAPLGTLLALTAFHVLCEEIFFRGFVTRKLLDSFATPLAPVVLSGLLFGVYHITFTSFWWITPMAIPAWVGMVTIGAGIPYAALYARSNSILVPLAAHLCVNLLMMFRSHGAVSGLLA